MTDPPGRPQVPIPTGLQTLLRLASVDAAFLDQVVRLRGDAADAAGVALTTSERAVLASLPAAQLRQMAERLPPPSSRRREFLRQTAATAVVLLGGAALAGTIEACCGEETPLVRPDHRPMDEVGGAAPDWPPEKPELDEDDDSAEAPTRPDYREMDTGGGAAPDMPAGEEE